MLSVDEIDFYGKDLLSQRLQKNTKEIASYLEKTSETVTEGFLKIFQEVFTTCIEMQTMGRKGKVAFIHIFYLETAILTETYELQINLFDKNSYFDKNQCYGFWVPQFFLEYFMDDIRFFKEKASANIVGFDYGKYQEFKRKYYTMYLALIGEFIFMKAKNITELKAFQELNKEKNISILFGSYMTQGIQVYPPLEVKA